MGKFVVHVSIFKMFGLDIDDKYEYPVTFKIQNFSKLCYVYGFAATI